MVRTIVAVLAALPGFMTTMIGTFKFAARSDWFWTKHHMMDALDRQLEYEGKNEQAVSENLTQFISRHESAWPSFGQAPKQP
jgi:hypothetical protein